MKRPFFLSAILILLCHFISGNILTTVIVCNVSVLLRCLSIDLEKAFDPKLSILEEPAELTYKEQCEKLKAIVIGTT